MSTAAINDEIQSISCHNIRPLFLHGYIGPFVILYAIWLYSWIFIYGLESYFEAGLIVLAIIGLLQILVSLFCVWSVDVRCSLTCSKVKEPLRFLHSYKLINLKAWHRCKRYAICCTFYSSLSLLWFPTAVMPE